MKRILVTGATGFVGRQTLRPLLERKFEVHAVYHSSVPPDVDDVTWHRTDLLASTDVVADILPSHVLHLAWFAEPGAYWTSEKNLDWVNATLNLARAFARSGGRRFVGAGSCAEYDWSSGICREEGTRIDPRSIYGASKHAADAALRSYFRQNGISVAWARIFFIYGPNEHPDRLVASVIRALLEGRTAKSSKGDQRRDFMHVADTASALAALVDCDVAGAVNIGSGSAPAVREVVETIGRLTDGSDHLAIGALPKKENDPPLIQADVRRLRDEVGWMPHFDLERGLEDTITWWKERLADATSRSYLASAREN